MTMWLFYTLGVIVCAVIVIGLTVPEFVKGIRMHRKQLRSDRVHREAVDRARGEWVIRLSDYRRAR